MELLEESGIRPFAPKLADQQLNQMRDVAGCRRKRVASGDESEMGCGSRELAIEAVAILPEYCFRSMPYATSIVFEDHSRYV